MNEEHHVMATSFADPADVIAFRKCKALGVSDRHCFKVGDNGIGFWQDDTSQGSGPSCALPPDDIIAKWGTTTAAKHKIVIVKRADGTKQVQCVLKDTMPWKKNITNGAGIDLNPDAVHALGWSPPLEEKVIWSWA